MTTNQPQELLEWQMQCVLKSANLLQYYDNFVREGECNVFQLTNAEDEKFKDVMKKVGMTKKPLDVHQFRKTLFEWTKDQEQAPRRKTGWIEWLVGFFRKKSSNEDVKDIKTKETVETDIKGNNEHVPFDIKHSDDDTHSPGAQVLMSSERSAVYFGLPLMKKEKYMEQTNRGPVRSIDKSVKKVLQPQQDTKPKQSQLDVKVQKQHGLVPYYDELLDNTILDKMVLDNLISRCILMIEDRAEIVKPTTQRERNRVLLNILADRPYSTFQVLKDVLQEANPHNTDVQELVNKIQCSESIGEHISCHDIIIPEHIVKLQKNYLMFVDDVNCKTDILDHLCETVVLDTEEKEEIDNSSITRYDSNRLLLSKLVRKGEDAYRHLLEALRHGQYINVASDMELTQVSENEKLFCKIGKKKLRDREKHNDDALTNAGELARMHNEVIPKHILEQFKRRLKQWKTDDNLFVSTAAEKQAMKSILTESSVTIVGNSGTGKTFLLRHVALTMMKQGYIIIPCDSPGDIRQWCNHERKTIFVFEDVCGRYTLNQQILIEWKHGLEHIQFLLDDTSCKIMSTCRLDVYKNEQLNRLSLFNKCSIDLSSEEFKLNAAENIALSNVYLNEKADYVNELSDKYDFFPLLCSLYHKKKMQTRANIVEFFSNPFCVFENELVELYNDGKAGKMAYCSLVLCVMFNNTLTEENLSTKDKQTKAMIEDILYECELKKGTPVKSLKKSLEKLEGTYVVKKEKTYKIIHDKLFDFLAKIFGQNMLQLFIDYAHTDFIKERYIWEAAETIGTEYSIIIPNYLIIKYISRLQQDWENGFIVKVFTNSNMTSLIFVI